MSYLKIHFYDMSSIDKSIWKHEVSGCQGAGKEEMRVTASGDNAF